MTAVVNLVAPTLPERERIVFDSVDRRERMIVLPKKDFIPREHPLAFDERESLCGGFVIFRELVPVVDRFAAAG